MPKRRYRSIASAVGVPDVRAIPLRLQMSRQKFAEACRIPLPTLKNGEQGRRAPMRRPPLTSSRSRASRRSSGMRSNMAKHDGSRT
jgi:hypothetical protein